LLVDGRRQVQATEEDLTSMATLADSFLADLDDLSDDDDVADEPVKDEPAEDGVKAEAAEGPIGGVDFRSLDAVAKLVGGERYRRVISQVDDALAADAKKKEEEGDASTGPGSTLGVVDEGAYQLIVDCNALSVEIENEIQVVHNFIRDRYRAKFPELESLVMHPIDYARVVKVIGNEMDMTRVELESVLPNATIMVVSVTGSTTNGQPLSAEDLEATVRACDVQLQLDADKRKLVALVEARMDRTAPNLSAVLGPEVASKLMSVAGGLVALSKMPANNVQVLGQKRKAAAGMSSATAVKSGDLHVGFINQCDIIQRKTPPPLRMRAARLVAGKCTLMARVDAFGEDPSGTTGRGMHTEMVKKIEKWQEPPPARTAKPLAIPGGEAKKRRGGKRARAWKERFGASDMRKAANRVNFNVAEEEIGYEGEGLGTLGTSAGMAAASGKLKLTAKPTKMKVPKNVQKKLMNYGSGGATNGLSSSLAFTPIQGIELANPTINKDATSGTDSVFSEMRGFRKVTAAGLQRQLKD
jgi:U4/U6 small nuclear ribonucleoprotein PRP31